MFRTSIQRSFVVVIVLLSIPGAGSDAIAQSGATTAAENQIFNDGGSTTFIAFSLVEGGLSEGNVDGGGNIDEDPLLLDTDGADNILGSIDDDVGIQASSAAVDAGSDGLLPSDKFDIDGDGDTSEPIPIDILGSNRSFDSRGVGAVVDMGAHESGTASPVGTEVAPNTQPLEFDIPFPNPIRNNGALTFRLPMTERVKIAVYDVMGRRRLVLFDSTALGDREYRVEIPATDLSSGMYFVRLSTASYEKVSEFVVVR